nr:immunoglobulin light chain junction region [Macaca mulatta]MOW27385.1 immunoglobulin light chain junction region [Macaca mulatta]MOW27405.1 immunoglobulin light chain junction region [Macaca mulatta]MOW29587.1 immunoglobulin light chain junction region [Macaca mulatta]MOW30450.1 immunoglobulin light chain junction region [Macaca mulatta]
DYFCTVYMGGGIWVF